MNKANSKMKDDLIFKKFQIFYQKKYRAKKGCSNRRLLDITFLITYFR